MNEDLTEMSKTHDEALRALNAARRTIDALEAALVHANTSLRAAQKAEEDIRARVVAMVNKPCGRHVAECKNHKG